MPQLVLAMVLPKRLFRIKPRVVIGVPSGITEMERRAVRSADRCGSGRPREVPGKALPGGRARRRAVEGHTKAGVPAGGDVSRFPQPRPTVTLEVYPRRLGKAASVNAPNVGVSSPEMEVIL